MTEEPIFEFNGYFRFLSNFYPSKVLSPTLEHHYQLAKTKLWHYEIMKAVTPGEAKRIGREFPLKHWELVKTKVMLVLVQKKFQEPKLRDLLLKTGVRQLVEGNRWHDNYWGSCYCKKCENVTSKNWLGEILMRVREEIRTKLQEIPI